MEYIAGTIIPKGNMKNVKYISLFMLLILTAVSCNTAPANRPTLLKNSSLNDTEEPDVTQEDLDKIRQDKLKRPDNAVKIQSDFCACEDGEAVSFGSNCESYCIGKGNAGKTLYFNVAITEAISERTDIGTFERWCNKPIVDVETETQIGGEPICQLEMKDQNGSTAYKTIDPINPGSNSVSVSMTDIPNDQTYRFKLVETGSGVSSDTKQIRLTTQRINDPVGGPLATVPAYRYTCININTSTDGVSLFYESASRLYFYFNPETRPDPLTAAFPNIFCHDKGLSNAPINDPLLEQTPNALTLWDALDPRFFDTDGNGVRQVYDLILQSLNDQGVQLDQAPEIFYKFQWAVGLDVSTADGDSSGTTTVNPENADLGFYMTPWTDQQTFKSYCPKQSHYNSNNQLFAALKEIVGVDTEGIYIAEQESGSSLLLVRESDVKPIWFYKVNNIEIEPNENTIKGKKIQFYWPADPNSPYIKKSHQTTYTVKRASEIGEAVSQDSQNNDGVPSQIPTHDKRIGCIPKL